MPDVTPLERFTLEGPSMFTLGLLANAWPSALAPLLASPSKPVPANPGLGGASVFATTLMSCGMRFGAESWSSIIFDSTGAGVGSSELVVCTTALLCCAEGGGVGALDTGCGALVSNVAGEGLSLFEEVSVSFPLPNETTDYF